MCIIRMGSRLCPVVCHTRVIKNLLWVLYVFHFAWVSVCECNCTHSCPHLYLEVGKCAVV